MHFKVTSGFSLTTVNYSLYFHFHFCDCIDRCNSNNRTITLRWKFKKNKTTSNDFLSSSAGTGGNVA